VEYAKDHFTCQLLDRKIQDDNFRVIKDLIYYKGRIFLVPSLRNLNHARLKNEELTNLIQTVCRMMPRSSWKSTVKIGGKMEVFALKWEMGKTIW
jgi:hypothetical protein